MLNAWECEFANNQRVFSDNFLGYRNDLRSLTNIFRVSLTHIFNTPSLHVHVTVPLISQQFHNDFVIEF